MNRKYLLPGTLVILVIVFLAWTRWHSPEMSRPLEYDEFYTIEYYTWAGFYSSGQPRSLRRVQDYYQLTSPTLLQFTMGLYRTFGVWKEPNNHIVNSFLINVVLARGSPTTQIARLPALLGAIIFALGIYVLTGPVLGWYHSAPLTAVWAFCCPYTFTYSTEARGYSWALALQVILLILAFRLADRPGSMARSTLMTLVAVLSFLNIVNLALDWVIPFYLALWLVPPATLSDSQISGDRGTWQRNLFAQLLVIGAIGFVFALDRLPYIYSSMRQYGIPFATGPQFATQLGQLFRYLFPNLLWIVVAIGGIVGWSLLLVSREYRCMGFIIFLTFVISTSHFVLSGKLPYYRAAGFYLPLVFIGFAYLSEKTIRSGGQVLWRRTACFMFGLLTFSLYLIQGPLQQPRALPFQFPASLSTDESTNSSDRTYAVLPPRGDYIIGKYLPANWLLAEDALEEHSFSNLCLFLKYRNGWGINMTYRAAETWQPLEHITGHLAPTLLPNGAQYYLLLLKGKMNLLSNGLKSHGDSTMFFIWYPNPDRLGLDSSEVMNALNQAALPFIRRNINVSCKLDFMGRLNALEFLAQKQDEQDKIRAFIQSAQERFGGHAFVFVASESAVQKHQAE